MRALHLFFRLHRPYELKPVDGVETDHFGGEAAFREANRTEYQPFLALLERNSQKYPKFVFSLAISGLWLEQAERWDPELVRRLRKLVNLGHVQLLAEPYYYSLASFYSADEFESQMNLHKKKMEYVFGMECRVLAMPELMYNDQIAQWAEQAGFIGILSGGMERVLPWRNVNQIFEAEGCKTLRVLCQNSRFSHAIMQGTDLTMVEGVKVSNKFADDTDDAIETAPVVRKKSTAADFVKGLHGANRPKIDNVISTKEARINTTGQMVFSAKKLQKELEIECLRGNLVSVCLDTQIFSRFRSEGIVRFFDELISNWLKVPGNQFLNISEAIAEAQPQTVISVKTTTNWRAEESFPDPGLIALDQAQFCPPDWLNLPEQKRLSERVYAMRDNVLMTNDEVLQYYFGRLTCLDYVAMFNPNAPILVGDNYTKKRNMALAQENLQRFEAVLDDFAQQIISKQPKPQKLAAEATQNATALHQEGDGENSHESVQVDTDSDFAVKVHRTISKEAKNVQNVKVPQNEMNSVAGEKVRVQQSPRRKTESLTNARQTSMKKPKPQVKYGVIEDYNPEIEKTSWDSVVNEAPEILDFKEDGAGAPIEIAETDEVDNAAAEVQVLAQRLAQKTKPSRNYEGLAEAEVVDHQPQTHINNSANAKKTKTKKGIFRRLTVE